MSQVENFRKIYCQGGTSIPDSRVIELKAPLKVSVDLNTNDTLRVFKGDKPAGQFEARQQKGGNYYCFACGGCLQLHS